MLRRKRGNMRLYRRLGIETKSLVFRLKFHVGAFASPYDEGLNQFPHIALPLWPYIAMKNSSPGNDTYPTHWYTKLPNTTATDFRPLKNIV